MELKFICSRCGKKLVKENDSWKAEGVFPAPEICRIEVDSVLPTPKYHNPVVVQKVTTPPATMKRQPDLSFWSDKVGLHLTFNWRVLFRPRCLWRARHDWVNFVGGTWADRSGRSCRTCGLREYVHYDWAATWREHE